MAYSVRQKLYADFMLGKIGIEDTEMIEKYLRHLENIYGRWAGNYWDVSSCIDHLKDEIDIKKDSKSIVDKVITKSYSATDLSNYTYCPASYAINKSFEIDKPSGKERSEIGRSFHEQLRLLNLLRIPRYSDVGAKHDLNDNDILREIKNSENIYYGHEEGSKFFNNKDFSGKPDYIFKDEEGKYFVVEEKFQRKRDPNRASYDEISADFMGYYYNDEDAEKERKDWENFIPYFFNNHVVQVVAYIKNILEYPISYGYLVYWYYDVKNDEANVHKVTAKRIELNDVHEKLYVDALNGIRQLQEEHTQMFQTDNLSIKKCAGCVVNKYCGHKTYKFSSLTFPYRKDCLRLYFVKFPDELAKKGQVNVIIPPPSKSNDLFTIEQIKVQLGFTALNMVRQLDGQGNKTVWLSHWDNVKRIRVTMHEIVFNKILTDKSIDTLQIERSQVWSTKTQKDYIRYIIRDKTEK